MQSGCSDRWVVKHLRRLFSVAALFCSVAAALTGGFTESDFHLDVAKPLVPALPLTGLYPTPAAANLPSGQWLVPVPPQCQDQPCNLALALEPNWYLDCQPQENCQPGPVVNRDRFLEHVKPHARITITPATGKPMQLLTVAADSGEPWPLETTALMVRLQTPDDSGYSPVFIARADPLFICDPDSGQIDLGWFRRHQEQQQRLPEQFRENRPAPFDHHWQAMFADCDCLGKILSGELLLSREARRTLQDHNIPFATESVRFRDSSTVPPQQIVSWRWRITDDGKMVLDIQSADGSWQQISGEAAMLLYAELYEQFLERITLLFSHDHSPGPYGYTGRHSASLRRLFDQFRRDEDREYRRQRSASRTLGTTTVKIPLPSGTLSFSPVASGTLQPGTLQPAITPTPAPSDTPGLTDSHRPSPTPTMSSKSNTFSDENRVLALKKKLGMSEQQFTRWLSMLAGRSVNADNASTTLVQLSLQGRLKPSWYLPSLILVMPMDKVIAALDHGEALVQADPQASPSPAPSELEKTIQQLGWLLLNARQLLTRVSLFEIWQRLTWGPQSIRRPQSLHNVITPDPIDASSDPEYQSVLLAVIADTIVLNLESTESVQMVASDVKHVLNSFQSASPDPEDPDPAKTETAVNASPLPSAPDWSDASSHLLNLHKLVKSKGRHLMADLTLDDDMRFLLQKLGYSTHLVTLPRVINGSLELEIIDAGHQRILRMDTFASDKLPVYQKLKSDFERIQEMDVDAARAVLPVHAQYLHHFKVEGFGIYIQVTPFAYDIKPGSYSRVRFWQYFYALARRMVALGDAGVTFNLLSPSYLKERNGRWVIVGTRSGLSVRSGTAAPPLKELTGILINWHDKMYSTRRYQKDRQIRAEAPDEFTLMDQLVRVFEDESPSATAYLSNMSSLLAHLFPTADFGGDPDPVREMVETPLTASPPAFDYLPGRWKRKAGEPHLNPAKLTREELQTLFASMEPDAKQQFFDSLNEHCYRYSGETQHILIDDSHSPSALRLTRELKPGARYLVTDILCTARAPRPYFLVVRFLAGIDPSVNVRQHPLRIPAYTRSGNLIPAFQEYLAMHFPLVERIGRLNRTYVLRIAPQHIQGKHLSPYEHWCLQLDYDEMSGLTEGIGRIVLPYPRKFHSSRTADREYFARFSRQFLSADSVNGEAGLTEPWLGLYRSARKVRGISEKTEDYAFFEQLLEEQHPPIAEERAQQYSPWYEKAWEHITGLKEASLQRAVAKKPLQGACFNCNKLFNPLILAANKDFLGFCPACISSATSPADAAAGPTHKTGSHHYEDDISHWPENPGISDYRLTKADFRSAADRVSLREQAALRFLAQEFIGKGKLEKMEVHKILKALVSKHGRTLNYIFIDWLSAPGSYDRVVEDIKGNHRSTRRR